MPCGSTSQIFLINQHCFGNWGREIEKGRGRGRGRGVGGCECVSVADMKLKVAK